MEHRPVLRVRAGAAIQHRAVLPGARDPAASRPIRDRVQPADALRVEGVDRVCFVLQISSLNANLPVVIFDKAETSGCSRPST